jgi:hypothetical protein
MRLQVNSPIVRAAEKKPHRTPGLDGFIGAVVTRSLSPACAGQSFIEDINVQSKEKSILKSDLTWLVHMRSKIQQLALEIYNFEVARATDMETLGTRLGTTIWSRASIPRR